MTGFVPRVILDLGDPAQTGIGLDRTMMQGEVHIHLHVGSVAATDNVAPASSSPAQPVGASRPLSWPKLGVAATGVLVLGYVLGGLGGGSTASTPVRLPLPEALLPQQTEQANLQRALAQPPAITLPPNAPLPAAAGSRNAFGLEN